jgi:hypothetical protein
VSDCVMMLLCDIMMFISNLFRLIFYIISASFSAAVFSRANGFPFTPVHFIAQLGKEFPNRAHYLFFLTVVCVLGGFDSWIEVVGEVVRREIGPLQKSIRYVLSDFLDPWEKVQTDSSSVNDESAPQRATLQQYYGVEGYCDCMLLGTLPDQHCCANIQRAHIWPKHTYGKGLEILDLSPNDLNSPRNYLLLQAEIEYYFDRKQFILLPVNIEDGCFSLRVVVLYPELLNKSIRICPRGNLAFDFPWSELNGLVSAHAFSEGKKPFLRLIAQHAFAAMKKAISSGAVDEHYCYGLRNEAVELARRSLGEDSIERVLDHNALRSLLVNVDSAEAVDSFEEGEIEKRKSNYIEL